MFSPIAQRSLKVRLLYLSLYVGLMLGGATMIIPFMIMIAGSFEPRPETQTQVLPPYIFNRSEMWTRYLATKYQDASDLLRMAWSEPGIAFDKAKFPEADPAQIKAWQEFLREVQPESRLFLLGFLRPNTRMPSYSGRQFRLWLMAQYGNDLSALNAALKTQFARWEAVLPPRQDIVGPTQPDTELIRKYREFVRMQPETRLIAWNAGGYFRGVLLPMLYGPDPAKYNEKHGTNYTSFRDVPFPATAPVTGLSDWKFFVTKVLCPDFVQLTPDGEEARKAAGVSKEEFIPTLSKPEQLRVTTLDQQFADWASARGLSNQRIPQAALDWEAFEKEELFWKWQFLTMNYERVLDEILLHGRAIVNTLILVTLSVCGALIVNPLAAYALSRFKLRKTYHILLFCLATIAFPAEVTMIPVFLQMKELHLLNTFGALVLPSLASGFSIFLLKGFFDSLPKELYEAAELDGASEWTMFWQITMNLSKPILAVIALGAFSAAYGTFFFALILAPDPKMWTIMVYIFQLRSGVDFPVVYASLIITAIPTLLVFIFFQNIILRGIVVPSDK